MSFITSRAQLVERFSMVPVQTVWAYLRVSDDSHEDNESPDVQRDAILGYCAAQKIPTPNFVYEKASAAKPLFQVRLPGQKPEDVPAASPRPLLSTLIAQLCERQATTLVVWKLDRLSRVAAEQDMLFSFFERNNIVLKVAYASESYLAESGASQDPVRVLMRQVLGAFAQYERHLIQMRMKLGSQAKYARGGWVGGGKPFGYLIKDNDLAIDPGQAELVRLVFNLSDAMQMTTRAVAAHFNANGHKGWNRMRVQRILTNRQLYRGVLVDPTGVEHQRPDLQILVDPVATIAPDDVAPPAADADDALPEPTLELP